MAETGKGPVRTRATAILCGCLILGLAPNAVAQPGITVPSETMLVVRVSSTLNSGDLDQGDRFQATLPADWIGGGVVIARRGSRIGGRVLEAKGAGRVVRKAVLEIELAEIDIEGRMFSLRTYPWGVEGEGTGEVRKIARRGAVGGVVGGAALAKRMAASKAVVSVITPGKQIEIPANSLIVFHLAEDHLLEMLMAPVRTDQTVLARTHLEAREREAVKLRRYSWTTRQNVAVDGETKLSQSFLTRFDATGELVQEPIGELDEGKARGIRGRIKKKKKEKLDELLDAVDGRIARYRTMTADEVYGLFARGKLVPVSGELHGTYQIQGIDIVRPGDWVTLWLDPTTARPRKLLVLTEVGGEALEVELDYRPLAQGLYGVAAVTYAIPARKIVGEVAHDSHSLRAEADGADRAEFE